MKKIIITVIAITFIFSVNAQKIGFKGGLNLSGVNSSTDLQDYQVGELLPGLNGGLVFEYCPKKIGVVAEAIYMQKGYELHAEVENSGTDIITDFSLNLDYIEVPVLFKLKLGPVYAVAGPYFGYAMRGEEIVSLTVDGEKLAEELYTDYSAIPSNDVFKSGEFNGDNISFKRNDFGLNIGVGAEFMMFFAEARYGVGLSNIEDYENIPEDEFTKNYTISFSVGMKFGR